MKPEVFKEAAFLFRPITPSASLVDVASKTRWMGDEVPRRGR